MRSILAIFVFCCAAACKPHGLPPLPPERDPTAEAAPVAPWQAPPDVLTTELDEGAPADAHAGHEHHEPAAPKGEPR